jgi:carbamoyl-phosphate synthase small subunit
MDAATAYVLLEDGTRFDGEACGADPTRHAVGEVVFTTGMSGYQESMTDPSFAGQLIAFTYPHIGNYGASARRWSQSARGRARRSCARRATARTRRRPSAAGWTG